jgi:hypothetical protein
MEELLVTGYIAFAALILLEIHTPPQKVNATPLYLRFSNGELTED